MSEDRALATAELLGALTYGQLRAFEVTSRAVRVAPDARAADSMSEFAVREHGRYRALRDRLEQITELPGSVMDRQKPRFDDYFDNAPVDDWLSACTFFAAGLPLVADFVRQIAPALDDETATVVMDALAERGPFERYARGQVVDIVGDDPDKREAVKHLLADVMGRALTQFQGAITDTDALEVLLSGDEGEEMVKRVAMAVLEGHRRRMVELGFDELD